MKETGYSLRGLAAALLALALGADAVRAGDVPFMESFDNLSSGALISLNEWETLRNQDVQVQTTVKFAGAKAAIVGTNAVMWNEFNDATITNVWIDFYARQPYSTNNTPPVITGSVAAAFYIDTAGALRVLSNDTWLTLSTTVPSNTWQRFTVKLDYKASRWSLFTADDVPNRLLTSVITNVPFASISTNSYFQAFRVKN